MAKPDSQGYQRGELRAVQRGVEKRNLHEFLTAGGFDLVRGVGAQASPGHQGNQEEQLYRQYQAPVLTQEVAQLGCQ